jgi:[1-hydroxy-2-(trimethylamino)ethyl]phosphonate dioxygenase
LEHALQTAWLVEHGRGTPSLIAAALLHDVGHLLHELGDDPVADGVDDRHEEAGHAFLKAWFDPNVIEPVRLHVAAKRYLCTTEPEYFQRLAPDSLSSLRLQGGAMSADEVAAFQTLAGHKSAVLLRRSDEQAKVVGLKTPPLEYFMQYVRSCIPID